MDKLIESLFILPSGTHHQRQIHRGGQPLHLMGFSPLFGTELGRIFFSSKLPTGTKAWHTLWAQRAGQKKTNEELRSCCTNDSMLVQQSPPWAIVFWQGEQPSQPLADGWEHWLDASHQTFFGHNPSTEAGRLADFCQTSCRTHRPKYQPVSAETANATRHSGLKIAPEQYLSLWLHGKRISPLTRSLVSH